MQPKLLIFLLLFMVKVNGQRIVNKTYFVFPASTTIDTIGIKFPYKFILKLDSGLRIAQLTQKNEPRIPDNAKEFFTPTIQDVHLADSLIKSEMLGITISGDSLLYIRNELYKWYVQEPTDFYKYKSDRMEMYKRMANKNKKKAKRSDRYYLGYFNQQGKKRLIILFDPKRIKYRSLGDILDVDFLEPMVLDIETRKISFGYFPYPDID